ncbi:MAG: nucleotidyltransferase family protein [archaeon]|nr:nucleotidyltransferase family protein [archaeon]
MNKEIDKIKEKIVPILKENKVTKAGIFGSYARGEQKKRSDVDILIEIGNWADLIDLARLKIALEKSLKRKVDLVEYGGIRKELKESVLNDEIQILS